jgi:hypothetical protein
MTLYLHDYFEEINLYLETFKMTVYSEQVMRINHSLSHYVKTFSSVPDLFRQFLVLLVNTLIQVRTDELGIEVVKPQNVYKSYLITSHIVDKLVLDIITVNKGRKLKHKCNCKLCQQDQKVSYELIIF